MADAAPPHLLTMRQITGTLEQPGSGDNPTIMGWADDIARRFPEMAAYSKEYTHDSIPWCGLTVAYCMAANGIRPPFGNADTDKFLWAASWSRWGTRLDTPRLGAVMVFTRSGGGHVALYEGEDDNSYIVRGGNQSDAVNVTHMPKSQFTAAVWPPVPDLIQSPVIVPAEPTKLPNRNSAKGSWYSQYEGTFSWVDPGDEPGSNALGVPDDEQGIAFPTRAALGQWFDVTAPNGVTLRLQQTDVGPGARTGRGIDISAVAAERFGYTPRNFPTDDIFSWVPAGARPTGAPVVTQPILLPPPARPAGGIDPNLVAALEAIVSQLGPVVLQAATSQQGKAFFSAVLPKLLGALGLSVPGIGIIGMVASFVIPALLPDIMGSPTQTSGGVATFASSLGVFGLGAWNAIKGALDRVGGRDK